MKVPDRHTKEGVFLSFGNSIHLPSNLLSHVQARTTTMSFKANTIDSSRYSSTLNATTKNFHTLVSKQQRPNRYEPAKTTRDVTKEWIIDKQNIEKQRHSLSKQLRYMRGENGMLYSFSLSKLLSKMKMLKDNQQHQGQLSTLRSNIKKNSLKQVVKPRVFKFIQLQDQKLKFTNFRQTANSLQISPRRLYQQDESTKIFKKYYCPSSSYRDPSFFKDIYPKDKYIYKDGKKVQSKRIHNFYTSHMYKQGFSRHYRKIDYENDMLEICNLTEGLRKPK